MPRPVQPDAAHNAAWNLHPNSVLCLICLHLFFVAQIALSNFTILSLWFSHPAIRINFINQWLSSPVARATLPATFSPWIEGTLVVYAICLLGLAYGKSWAWWLALVLDLCSALPFLFFLYSPYLFLRPFSWAATGSLILDALAAATFCLLFVPAVVRHFSVHHFIARFPLFESTVSRISFPSFDRVFIRIIAVAQLLAAALEIVGYSMWSPFIALYALAGIVSAGFLFKGRKGSRFASVCWQAVSLVTILYFWVERSKVNGINPRADLPEAYFAAYSILAIVYLVGSLLYLRYRPAALARPLQIPSSL